MFGDLTPCKEDKLECHEEIDKFLRKIPYSTLRMRKSFCDEFCDILPGKYSPIKFPFQNLRT